MCVCVCVYVKEYFLPYFLIDPSNLRVDSQTSQQELAKLGFTDWVSIENSFGGKMFHFKSSLILNLYRKYIRNWHKLHLLKDLKFYTLI